MSSQSALYSLCRLRSLALASALPLAGCYATPSLDNPRFENGPDGQDLRSLVCADDGDCDGTLAADDCDDADPDSLTRTEDGDCDGALTGYDCDDADSDSLTRAEDGDCDGTLPADDCNDADPNSLTRAQDGDCDGARTADDCDDGNPSSRARSDDRDCDGFATAHDCDDADPQKPNLNDQDCDGFPNGGDCDDNDASLGDAVANDPRCESQAGVVGYTGYCDPEAWSSGLRCQSGLACGHNTCLFIGDDCDHPLQVDVREASGRGSYIVCLETCETEITLEDFNGVGIYYCIPCCPNGMIGRDERLDGPSYSDSSTCYIECVAENH